MAQIMMNPTGKIVVPPTINPAVTDEEKGQETEEAREERKATGRTIAIVIFLSVMCVALYQVVQRRKTALAGVLVPCIILFTYTFFVVHISKKDKKRRKQLESTANNIELSSPKQEKSSNLPTKKIPNVASVSSISSPSPSTSGKQSNNKTQYKNVVKPIESMRIASKTPNDPSTMVAKKKAPPPFKKAPSQSHIQVKSLHAAQFSLENETKKLKKSRSFDRHSHLEIHRKVDNKKIKTKI